MTPGKVGYGAVDKVVCIRQYLPCLIIYYLYISFSDEANDILDDRNEAEIIATSAISAAAAEARRRRVRPVNGNYC